MDDKTWERLFRKDLRHIVKLLASVSDEALVLVPDLLTEEMDKRSEALEKRDPRLHYHGQGWPSACTLEHKEVK